MNQTANILNKNRDLSAADFDRARALIRRTAGIELNDSKRSLVFGRLNRRVRELKLESFSTYLNILDDPNSPEWENFVNALTTNLTSFFRESHHFDALQTELASVPPSGNQKLKIWCTAASTGEEPYSIAMTAHEAMGRNPQVQILATDIDTKVLAHASQGVYDDTVIGKMPPNMARKYFLRGKGRNQGKYRVQPELAKLITFDVFNLIETPWQLDGPFDIIFCRNVLIYFDRDTKLSIIERFHKFLKPGGLLFIGHSENFSDKRELFSLQGKTIYRRVA